MSRGYDYKQYAILYVDDEVQSLKYFSKALAQDFKVVTAATAAEGWKHIEQDGDQIGVLITDQRMPAESGVSLLERVKRHRPNIVRILTTAYSDLSSAIDAVNTGGAFRYITKPWNFDELRGTLMRAMEFFLVKQDRDQLIAEKLSILQRIMVMDRIRGLAALSAALESCLRNPLAALQAYLAQAPLEEVGKAVIWDAPERNLGALARLEGENLVRAVRRVLEATLAGETLLDAPIKFDRLMGEVVNSQGESAEGLTFTITADPLPTVLANPQQIKRLFELICDRIRDMDGEDREVRIAMTSGDDDSIRIRITTNAPQWTRDQMSSMFSAVIPRQGWLMGVDMDVLAAFFIAHHYGGTISIDAAGPEGPGILLMIPRELKPPVKTNLDAAWFDQVFGALEP